MSQVHYKYGRYGFEKGWAIYRIAEEQIARLQIYHLVNSLRCGDRPADCIPVPPANRTLVEFAAAAWTPFHTRLFHDPSVPGHHREPAWLEFTSRLEDILTRRENVPLEAITEQIFDELIVAPFQKYIERERPDWLAPRPFGVFSYGVRDQYVALHIHNCFMPDSPFEHVPELITQLQQIIDDVRRQGLDIQRIGVDSWINLLPAFQPLFPPEFAASITPTSRDAKGGNGWWGQFYLRTGEFNERRAARLRQTRRFDYIRSHAECSFPVFCEHVAIRLSAAASRSGSLP